MLEIFENLFWLTATQAVKLFVPIISIILLFKLIHLILFKGLDR